MKQSQNPVSQFVKFLRSKASLANRIKLFTAYCPRKLWAKDNQGNLWHFSYEESSKVKDLLKNNPCFDILY